MSIDLTYTFDPSTAITVRLPHAFYNDHADRALPSGRIERQTKAHLYVALDGPAFRDLWSDAKHYAWLGTAELGQGFFGLVSSARATVKVLEAIAPEDRPA